MMAPKGRRRGVVIGDEPNRIGHVDGGRERLEYVAEVPFAPQQRVAGTLKKPRILKQVLSACWKFGCRLTHAGPS